MPDLTSIAHLEKVDKHMIKQASVVDRIEAHLEDMNALAVKIPVEFTLGNAGRPKGVFSASMVGEISGKALNGRYPMGCGRKLFYAYTGVESAGAWEPRLRRRLDEGTAVHALVQTYLHEFARENADTDHFESEVRVSPDTNEVADRYDLSGHADGIYTVVTPKGKLRFGLEIKSISMDGFKATSGPHPEHLIQGTIYQKCLDLPLMLFLYWNVNDCQVAEYIQVFDEARWEAVVAKVDYVRSKALVDEMPEQEVTFSCRTCQYKGACKPPRSLGRLDRNVHSAFRNSMVTASREAKE